MMAGATVNNPNNKYYLYNNQDYWTMSPIGFYDGVSRIGFVLDNGNLIFYCGVADHGGTRPVINIKADIQIIRGDGSSLNPFVIK